MLQSSHAASHRDEGIEVSPLDVQSRGLEVEAAEWKTPRTTGKNKRRGCAGSGRAGRGRRARTRGGSPHRRARAFSHTKEREQEARTLTQCVLRGINEPAALSPVETDCQPAGKRTRPKFPRLPAGGSATPAGRRRGPLRRLPRREC